MSPQAQGPGMNGKPSEDAHHDAERLDTPESQKVCYSLMINSILVDARDQNSTA